MTAFVNWVRLYITLGLCDLSEFFNWAAKKTSPPAVRKEVKRRELKKGLGIK